MRPALKREPAVDFPKPATVVTAVIDPVTGLLATPDCLQRREEFYLAGTEPTAYCPKHGGEKLAPLPAPAPPPSPE